MTPDSPRPSNALLAEVSRDLHPVKPSPLPSRLALRLAPLAVVMSSAILLLIGFRKDAGTLGPLLMWGPSITQFGLAIMLVWIAAREGTPARRLPKNFVLFATVATCLVVAGMALWTFEASPSKVPSRVSPWVMGAACGVGGTIAGTLLVILFGWVFRRSLAARPAIAGALYGAGAGIAVNAGWRLACPVSTPWHSLGAHGAAIVLTTLLGAVAYASDEPLWRMKCEGPIVG
jgi:hypothetical protein